MQNPATRQEATDASRLGGRYFSTPVVLSVLFLAGLWFVLCRQLSGEWSVNAQYNFGWFVPFFAVYLFWLRWQDRPATEVRSQKSEVRSRTLIAWAIAIVSLLLLLPVRLFEVANPEWRLLAWIHALVVVTLTLLLVWRTGGSAWLRHFAFPVVLILVAVPWPTALEAPVIQGLMRVVARVAAETAMLLGTPAEVEGNLIRVSNGLVGVNEACSGIRSLQTSLMIGLLFGELKRFSISRRVVLIAGAVVIALIANFVRAVFLVQVAATKNISEVTRWHDIAGYTIIGLVFVGTMLLAYLLGKSRRNSGFQPEPSGMASSLPVTQTGCPRDLSGRMPELPAQSAVSSQWSRGPVASWSVVRSPYLAAALCWLLFVEIGTASWYRLHERNLISRIRWTAQWPQQAPNFRKLKIDEEIRALLRFDEGEAAAWTLTSPQQAGSERGVPTSCLLYVFRWNPGKNSALLANLHRPDVCLPASGWKQVADHGVRSYPISDSVELPFRHFEFQRSFEGSPPQTAHAFYCLSEDRAAVSSAPRQGVNLVANSPGMSGSRSEWTRAERLRTVLEGRRHLGQQVIEAIFISSEPFSAAEAEAHLRNLVRDVIRLREAD